MSAFSGQEFSLFQSTINADESIAEPSIFNLVGSMVDNFDLFGKTQTEVISPPLREQIVVTEGNYRELALAEIARQQISLGDAAVGQKKQLAILEAFQQLAGVKGSFVKQDTLDFLDRNVQRTSLSGQTGEFITRANDFAESTVKTVGNVVEFASSPFGLVSLGAVAILGAFLVLR